LICLEIQTVHNLFLNIGVTIIFFFIFSIIPPIYGIVCAIKDRPLGELFSGFAILAATCLGAIFYNAGMEATVCNTTFIYTESDIKGCHAIRSTIAGCFFF